MERIRSVEATLDVAVGELADLDQVPVTVRFNQQMPRFEPRNDKLQRFVEIHDTGRLRLRYPKTPDGRIGADPASVCIEGTGALSAEDLRKFPWGRVLRAASAQVRMLTEFSIDNLNQANEAVAELTPRRGRPPLPGDLYRDLADEYLRLVARGERAPAMRIAERTNHPYETVRRRIKEARKKGYLPKGQPGKAG